MKTFLSKYFGILGLAIYFVLAVIARIPVAVFFMLYIIVMLVILGPITKNEYNPRWVDRLYNWYCGK